jgi:hypothetical protein
MKIDQILKLRKYKVNEGFEYEWACYGLNAYIYNIENVLTVVFDTKTKEVFEISVYLHQPIRYINDKYISAYHQECTERGQVPNIAYDDVSFYNVPYGHMKQFIHDWDGSKNAEYNGDVYIQIIIDEQNKHFIDDIKKLKKSFTLSIK